MELDYIANQIYPNAFLNFYFLTFVVYLISEASDKMLQVL